MFAHRRSLASTARVRWRGGPRRYLGESRGEWWAVRSSKRLSRVCSPGVVSIVIVNYQGADDTIECLAAIRELDWPSDRLQVVVVDNASGDGSAARIQAAAAAEDITLVESPE